MKQKSKKKVLLNIFELKFSNSVKYIYNIVYCITNDSKKLHLKLI